MKQCEMSGEIPNGLIRFAWLSPEKFGFALKEDYYRHNIMNPMAIGFAQQTPADVKKIEKQPIAITLL